MESHGCVSSMRNLFSVSCTWLGGETCSCCPFVDFSADCPTNNNSAFLFGRGLPTAADQTQDPEYVWPPMCVLRTSFVHSYPILLYIAENSCTFRLNSCARADSVPWCVAIQPFRVLAHTLCQDIGTPTHQPLQAKSTQHFIECKKPRAGDGTPLVMTLFGDRESMGLTIVQVVLRAY